MPDEDPQSPPPVQAAPPTPEPPQFADLPDPTFVQARSILFDLDLDLDLEPPPDTAE
jgi:hypothetical protein